MKFFNGETSSIHSAAFLLGAAGLLSRILGIFRDRLLAGEFGAGKELDIYYTAFQIPDFMSLVFLLGAGSAAILPIFQDTLAKSRDEAHRLVSHLVTMFLVGALVVASFVYFAVPFLMSFIAPGFSAEDREVAALLTRIMLISPILLGLSGIFSSIVQSYQRFLAFALAPVLYNIGIILGIVVFVPWWGISGLAAGVVLGAFLHLLIQFEPVIQLGFVPHVWRHAFRDHLSLFFRGTVGRVLSLSFPRFLSLSVTQLTLIILVAIGSTLAEGSISVFKLASNLFYVPVGIFGISYGIAIFPRLHKAFLAGSSRVFYEELELGLRNILFWIVPSAVIFLVLRAHIVRVALGTGAFSWEDTRLAAAILGVLVFAMLAEGTGSLIIKGFYALESTWTPLFINIGASIISVVLALVFANLLSGQNFLVELLKQIMRIHELPHPEVLGLGMGFSAGLIVDVILLYRALIKLARDKLKEKYTFPVAPIFKIILASVIAGLAAYIVRVSFSQTLPLITFNMVLLQGALAGSTGFFVYFVVLYFFKSEEVEAFTKIIKRRLFRFVLPREWEEKPQL